MANDDDFDAGALLVEVTKLDGTLKTHKAWLGMLTFGAVCIAGLLIGFLWMVAGKADGASLTIVESRVTRAEVKQSGQDAEYRSLRQSLDETRAAVLTLNETMTRLIQGMARPPRKDR